MKVSIITPFHKGSHFLQDCLDGIAAQDFQDYEWIFVADHPEEEYEEILQEYQDRVPCVQVKLPEGSTGVAAARNAGLNVAQGEYLYFLDSDDYFYREDTLRLLVERADELEYDIAYGRKVGTWFKRAVFLETHAKAEEDSSEEESSEESEGESSEEVEDTEEETDAETVPVNSEILEETDIEETEEIEVEVDEATLERRARNRVRRTCRRIFPKFRSASVLHILVRRDLVEQYQIRFCEDFQFYSDMSFLLELLEHTSNISRVRRSIYVKRKHNDPVNLPALSQMKSERRFQEMVDAYWYSIKRLDATGYVRRYLDSKVIQYYISVFMKKLRRSKNEEWRTTRFEQMRQMVAQMDKQMLVRAKRFRKKAIRALLKGNVKRSLNLINRRLALRKIKRIFHSRNKREIFKYLYEHYYLNMSMKENWVMCESFLGKNYADSPKYLYEYLQKNFPDKYHFIWVNNSKSQIPYRHTRVKRFSFRYFYYLGRSKYFVFNMRQPIWMQKRAGSVFLETWHGTPLKRLVFDMEDVYSATPLYKYEVYRQTRDWDYLIAANEFSSNVFRSCFLYDKNMLEYGYPRNDILHAPDREEKAAEIRRKLGIPKDKKTILYAPTWRDDEYYGKGQYKFTLKLDLIKMREALGREYVILLRTHYFIADSLDVSGVEDFAYNLSKYDDIADIYLISDICITDYSSVFFDYANLKRPILFYTYDLEKYRDMLRGFYIDMEKEVPGPLLFTTEEVIDAVQNINEVREKYQKVYDAFYERFCGWEDGHASENIAKEVFGL